MNRTHDDHRTRLDLRPPTRSARPKLRTPRRRPDEDPASDRTVMIPIPASAEPTWDRTAPTVVRPAFDVDAEDFARAASQVTLVPGERVAARDELEIVSPTATRDDWEAPPEEPAAAAPRPPRRWWLALAVAGGLGALAWAVTAAGEPPETEVTVLVLPGPPIVVPLGGP